jgi:hypothetical protein
VRALLVAAALLSACLGDARDRDELGACCMVCDVGKACGDSCIARGDTCYEGAGCACNAGGDQDAPLTPEPVRDCCPDTLPVGCECGECLCDGHGMDCEINCY